MKSLKIISESIFDDQDKGVSTSMLRNPKSKFWSEFMNKIFTADPEVWYRIKDTRYDERSNTLSLDFKGVLQSITFDKPDSIFSYLDGLEYSRKNFGFRSEQLLKVNSACSVFDSSYLGSHLWLEKATIGSKLIANVTIDLPEYKTTNLYGCVQIRNVEVFCGRGEKLARSDQGEVMFSNPINRFPIFHNFRIGNIANFFIEGPTLIRNEISKIEKLFDFTDCCVGEAGSEKVVPIKDVNKLFSVITKPKRYTLIKDLDKLYRIKPEAKISDLGLEFTDLTNTLYFIEIMSGKIDIIFCRPTIQDCSTLYARALRTMGMDSNRSGNEQRELYSILSKNRTADGWVVIVAARK